MYIHSASTEPGTAVRIRGHPHPPKCKLGVLSKQEIQVRKLEGPVHMFKLLHVLGCF